jgi:putative ABC transport system substrate-binding protein
LEVVILKQHYWGSCRLTFFTLALVLPFSLFLGACGDSQQTTNKSYNVGVYIDAPSLVNLSRLDGLKDGMKSLGYEEGKNIQYQVVQISKDTTSDQETAIMKDFAAKNYDAYWLMSSQPTLKLKTLVTQKPIIVAGMPDPVAVGLVKSMEKPGVNISGVDNLNLKLSSKRLELLVKIKPDLKTVYLLYNPQSSNQKLYIQEVHDTAAKLGITLIDKTVTSKDESLKTVPNFSSKEAQAILTLGSNSYSTSKDELKMVVQREKLILVGTDRDNLNDGTLFSYGANNYELGKQSTEYLSKVLHGIDPATLSVLQAEKIEFIISKKVADQLGLQLPENVVSSADEVLK